MRGRAHTSKPCVCHFSAACFGVVLFFVVGVVLVLFSVFPAFVVVVVFGGSWSVTCTCSLCLLFWGVCLCFFVLRNGCVFLRREL